MMQATVSMSGPLPIASEFGGYEAVLPGSADRILTMAEKDQDAQIEINKRDSQVARLGFLFSTALTTLLPWAFLVATVWLAIVGSGWAWLTGALMTATGAPQIVVNIRNAFNRNGGEDEPEG